MLDAAHKPPGVFQSLRGSLLIAMPSLLDLNFYRAVVLLIEHSEQGAFGIIINRSVDLSLCDVLQNSAGAGFHNSHKIWFGGPVETGRGLFMHNIAGIAMEAPLVVGDLFLCGNDNIIQQLVALDHRGLVPPEQFRFFLGYAGWGAMQLEQEIRHASWLHCPATTKLVLDTPADDLWETAIRSLGVNPEALVENREHPETLH